MKSFKSSFSMPFFRVTNFTTNLRQNWKAGLTVSLISLPLSVSLAVASQSTPLAGIITAIWAGLFAALFGGSHFNIVGPTGALSGLLASYAIIHGAGALSSLAIVAGLIILISSVLKLQKYLVFIPANTVHGFTLGVAFIIAFGQLNFALGINGLAKHEKFIGNLFESITHIREGSLFATIIFILFLGGLFVLRRIVPKIPGAIILAPIGILLGYASSRGYLPMTLDTLATKYTDIHPSIFAIPDLSFSSEMILPAFAIAIVAILETMISAKIADGMTGTKHDKQKEMLGLGLANIASGLAGGIPATAALARTSLNIKSGGTHKTAAAVSSISVAIISLIFLGYFQFIPLPVIAAILVFVAIRMVEREHFARLYRFDKKGFVIALIVAFITVYEDPIIGLLAGTAISLIVFVDTLSKGQFELVTNEAKRGIIERVIDEQKNGLSVHDTIVYSINGELAYFNTLAHISRLEKYTAETKNVILRLRELHFMDIDGLEAFDEIVNRLLSQEKMVFVSGVNQGVESFLTQGSHTYQKLQKQGFVFTKTQDALRSIGYQVRGV
jgi:SulP family sulfate permease